MENKIMMPASYNVLSCEEMTYTEGGATFTEALLNWIPPMIRAIYFRTFRIYMNPLMIQRCISKKINTFLREFHIIGNTYLLAY